MIRKMLISDVDEVYRIENQSFFEPWSKKNLLNDLEQNSILEHFVYEESGKVSAFYIISHVLDELEIFTIAVDKEYRKKGIGSKLLEHMIKSAKEKKIRQIRLEVSTKNEAAINLYEKFGFKKMGVRKNYYQKTGEDAYNMMRQIYE